MARKSSVEPPGGILMRGASGHLFFMRDGDEKPTRLKGELEKSISGAFEREPPGELLSFPASAEVRLALQAEFGELPFWGVIIWLGRRLRR